MVVILARVLASLHLVKQSITTIKYFLCPDAIGKDPHISTPHMTNGMGELMDIIISDNSLAVE